MSCSSSSSVKVVLYYCTLVYESLMATLTCMLKVHKLHTAAAHRLWERLQAMEQQLQLQELELELDRGDAPELKFEKLALASPLQQQQARTHKVSHAE